jgi:hypothetical protein
VIAAERSKILEALLGPRIEVEERIWNEFVEIAIADTDRVVPIVDEILSDREMDLRRAVACGHRVVDQMRIHVTPETLRRRNESTLIEKSALEETCIACMRENILLRAMITIGKIYARDPNVQPLIRKISADAVQELKAIRAG